MSELKQLPDQILQMSINRLRLPNRTSKPLLRAKINTIGDLVALSKNDIFKIRNIGIGAYNDIIHSLDALSMASDLNGQVNWSAYWEAQDLEPEIEIIEMQETTIPKEIELSSGIVPLSLGYLHLPIRAYNSLYRANILTIGDLVIATNKGLSTVYGLGSSSITAINAALGALVEAVNEDGQVDWVEYCTRQGITIIPQHYKTGASHAAHVKRLGELVKEILIQDDEDRDWRIVQRRFGLNRTTKLTLEQLGEGFGLTRERVRQIEQKALVELRNVLIANQYTGRNYRVHPEILSTVKLLFDALATQTKEFILETDLFELMRQVIGTDISKLHSELLMLFSLAGMDRIEFNDPDLVAIWKQTLSDEDEVLERVVTRLDNLLTNDVASPMEDFDILRHINKELPKDKKLTLLQLRRFIDLCSTIEQRDDGLFWGKFEYLKSRGNQVERLLIEANKPMNVTELTRFINSKLVIQGHRKLNERNLANQLPNDDRFVPIGRSGNWALKTWDHIDTSSVIALMERYLIERNEPATPEEIFEYVTSRRPVKESSIKMYLSNQPKLFRKADRTRWGLASWAETQSALTWKAEQVATFVAGLFKKYKTTELEFKIIRKALMEEAALTSKQAIGMLISNPVISTRKGPQWNDRIAVFQSDYKSKLATPGVRFTRKQATKREKLEDIVRKQLEVAPGYQLALAELISFLTSKHGFHEKTAYLYIRQAESIETVTVPGTRTKVCRLKDKQGLSFPQVSNITDTNLRESIEKAIVDLTEDDIDLGLFQLGREFEVIIKRSLIRGSSKGKVTLNAALAKDPAKWKLVNMVDCAKDNGLITDLGVANLLRQERNNRAHGSRPSLAERRTLMNAAQYIAGMYIDYIILFENFFKSWA